MKTKSSGRQASTASQIGWGRVCLAHEPMAIRESGGRPCAAAEAGARERAAISRVSVRRVNMPTTEKPVSNL